MGDSSLVYDGVLSHEYDEAEGLADDPYFDEIDRARRDHEEMTLPGVQPEVLPRGEVIEAEKRLTEAVAGKLGIDREYKEWLHARGVQAEKFSAVRPEREERVSYTFGPLQPLGPAAAGIGEMWWGRTDIRFPGGMGADFRPDGAHLFGELTRNDGDLWKGSLQALGLFVLSPNRMPPVAPGVSPPSRRAS
ncbi:hypothetical protein ACQPYK_35105 [Streptosporangium sp. CA-135522]|uniref:hypothetical protein n=1 Tax=Streptosporangium sp. CA-135522 TaxID=3240072 RepID=UPI003D8C2CD8